jgi:hypothetical protein
MPMLSYHILLLPSTLSATQKYLNILLNQMVHHCVLISCLIVNIMICLKNLLTDHSPFPHP